jgi:hypothetical protein
LIHFIWHNTGAAVVAQDIVDGIEIDKATIDIKDIDNTNERAEFIAWITRVMSLQQTLTAQANIRGHAAAFVGAIDAAGTTTRDVWYSPDWVNILLLIAQSAICIPTSIKQKIIMDNPRFVIEEANPAKRFKGCLYIPVCPHMTAAEAYTLIGEIQTVQQGALSYMRKVGLVFEKVSVTMGPMLRAGDYAEIQAFWAQFPVWTRDNAGAANIKISLDENSDETASDTWFEAFKLRYRSGTIPFPLIGFVRYLFGVYNAVHNTRGCLVLAGDASLGTTLAGDKAYLATIEYNGTSFTIDDGTALNLVLTAVHWASLTDTTNLTLEKTIEAGHLVLSVNTELGIFVRFWAESLSATWLSEVNMWNWLTKSSGGYNRATASRAARE